MKDNENKVLVDNRQIPKPVERDRKLGAVSMWGQMESCDLCHYDAFYKYQYDGEILYRCKGHKVNDINNLISKYHQ